MVHCRTVLRWGVTAGMMRAWARMMGIEFARIGKDTAPGDLFRNNAAWKLKEF